jgi:hypothetical protein
MEQLLPLSFITWYSGMSKDQVLRAHARWCREQQPEGKEGISTAIQTIEQVLDKELVQPFYTEQQWDEDRSRSWAERMLGNKTENTGSGKSNEQYTQQVGRVQRPSTPSGPTVDYTPCGTRYRTPEGEWIGVKEWMERYGVNPIFPSSDSSKGLLGYEGWDEPTK